MSDLSDAALKANYEYFINLFAKHAVSASTYEKMTDELWRQLNDRRTATAKSNKSGQDN